MTAARRRVSASGDDASQSDQRWLRWLWPVAAVWLAAVVGGLYIVWAYENKPGLAAEAPETWPAGTRLVRVHDRPTLVVLAHPRCSCTPATLHELAEALALNARDTTHPKTYVLFLRPDGFADGWEHTDLWRLAAQIPNVTLITDDRGDEARRFGGNTSGQTLLYDAAGRLAFRGGITGSRGHEGDNAGRRALVAAMSGTARHAGETNVFGCPLFAVSRDAQAVMP